MTWKADIASPFHVAARTGNQAELKALLSGGESPSALDEEGWSALHWACSMGSGPIELRLRPSRDRAMREFANSTAIWGEEVVLRAELVEKQH